MLLVGEGSWGERARGDVLMTAVYCVTSVKSWSTMVRAAGASAGVWRSMRALSGVGAATASEVKELAMAKQERVKVFMLESGSWVLLAAWVARSAKMVLLQC